METTEIITLRLFLAIFFFQILIVFMILAGARTLLNTVLAIRKDIIDTQTELLNNLDADLVAAISSLFQAARSEALRPRTEEEAKQMNCPYPPEK